VCNLTTTGIVPLEITISRLCPARPISCYSIACVHVGNLEKFFYLKLMGTKKHNCEDCSIRARCDKNPKSLFGRLWRWHINFCPGWITVAVLVSIFSFDVFAESDIDKRRYYDLSGPRLGLSFYNDFMPGIGFGYNWGALSTQSGHAGATDYGFALEYKVKNELHFRSYFDLSGGSAGGLIGASSIATTDFDKATAGIAPHLGIGIASVRLFYRYNFHINKAFNCHEVVFIYSLNSPKEKI